MTQNKPILSICIPTYNRAELLRTALISLVPQIKECGDDVELVVSDNCSTDNTGEVVEWAKEFGSFLYHRNEENIGAARNVMHVVNLATGEFCWVLGDDDFVRVGGVKKVLQILKDHSDIDYAFVNAMHINYKQLENYPQPLSVKDLPDDLRLESNDTSEKCIDKWELLIDPQISSALLGGIQLSVFRRSIWCKYSDTINIGEAFSSFDSTYPHLKIFAQGLVGKKAYYIGLPQIIVVDGAREWWDLVPMIILVRFNEMLDLYEHCGVESKIIRPCRDYVLSQSGPLLIRMLIHPNTPGREYVSVIKFIKRFWHYKAFRKSLARGLLMNLKSTFS
ncbi:MAG: glycosyltransferase family 2 protein [Euryarchaeota archaeon]|nr:glycosyltransferase family 2 protein [Euryarchaeota archaeon]MBU4038108.1 glycosyltransferase [Pseudomonadota bacterium]